MMETNPIKVSIVLNCGDRLTGEVNILSFRSFFDFIEQSHSKYIKLFNTKINDIIHESAGVFVLIPKKNIKYYVSFEKNKNILDPESWRIC
jgi:hypothetical protein